MNAKKQSKIGGKLANRLQQAKLTKTPHLIVEARAGTGKTFTLVTGVVYMFRKRVPALWQALNSKIEAATGKPFEPSPQQMTVWQSMEESSDAQSVQFVAFNKSIVTDFQTKWSWVVDSLKEKDIHFSFSTLHALGNKIVTNTFGRVQLNKFKSAEILASLLSFNSVHSLREKHPGVTGVVELLVSLCKQNLIDSVSIDEEFIEEIVEENGLDESLATNAESLEMILDNLPKILQESRAVAKCGSIDFNDMIWLPVVLDLPGSKADVMLIDESQDLNRCQQELAKRVGRRLVFVGDPKQAIYGFAGADSQSMERMFSDLSKTPQGCEKNLLTVTYRCGKAIVKEAQKYVEDFTAHESNCDGAVLLDSLRGVLNPKTKKMEGSYHDKVQDGDMVLCRTNAPLVRECLRFLREGRVAKIQGRNITDGLLGTIKKINAPNEDVPALIKGIAEWQTTALAKEKAKERPSDSRIQMIQDRHDCLTYFCEEAETVNEVIERIEKIFTDSRDNAGITLSSVHRAKGMESKRVWLLLPREAPMPHPAAKTKRDKAQELNLCYVAVTRAIEEFHRVR